MNKKQCKESLYKTKYSPCIT